VSAIPGLSDRLIVAVDVDSLDAARTLITTPRSRAGSRSPSCSRARPAAAHL
jgi:hypothetical protein